MWVQILPLEVNSKPVDGGLLVPYSHTFLTMQHSIFLSKKATKLAAANLS